MGRSREGAWIEIISKAMRKASPERVAPVRERGLKLLIEMYALASLSRSREGAWIEIFLFMIINLRFKVAPVRERGLKCTIVIHVGRITTLSLP